MSEIVKKDFEKAASEVINSLEMTGFSSITNKTESINLVTRLFEKYNFKSNKSLEVEILNLDSKENIINGIDSLLKVLCTSEELDDLAVSMRADIYILWNIRDYLNELLAKN